MPEVIKELAVSVGTYQDRNTGQTKNRYKNIGVVMRGEDNNGDKYSFLLLDRSFNPAGIEAKPGSDKIIVNMFDPKPREDRQDNSRGSDHSSSQQSNGGGYNGDPDDRSEIPF